MLVFVATAVCRGQGEEFPTIRHSPEQERGETPIALGSRRELFVDQYLISSMQGVRLQLHEPRDEGIVLKFDKPWEGQFSGYVTVLNAPDRFRAYYRGRPVEGLDGDENEYTCVAESADGKIWTRPDLDQFEVLGSKINNVVLAQQAPFSHNFTPCIDPRSDCPADERYKALAGVLKDGLFPFGSADGLHWRKLSQHAALGPNVIDTPGFVHAFDSQNVGFWSETERKFVIYFRAYENGMRRIYRAESPDFRNWTKPVRMEYETLGKPSPLEHLYTNQTSPYFRAPHIYLAIAARFMPDRQVVSKEEAEQLGINPNYLGDTSDAVLMSTRGGYTYDRTFLSSFIRPGIGARNWVSRTNYPALNVVQTSPEELSIYVNQDYAQPTAHLRRYSLRLDGFASVRGEYEGGELITHPLTFSGQELRLNYSTSAAGSLRVELQHADGTPISGFALNDCPEMLGNELDRQVRWQGQADLTSLAGKVVRLRIVLKDADLFALRFAP